MSLLKRIANSTNITIDQDILKKDTLNILETLKNNYDVRKYKYIWFPSNDNPVWMLLQLVIMQLKQKDNYTDIDEIKLSDLIIPILKQYVNDSIKPLLEHSALDPNIQLILNSTNDEHLVINFDPADSSQRDGAIVAMREFTANNQYIDHIFLDETGKTHSQIQDEYKDILRHSQDSSGKLTICHAHYWRPIVFLSGYNSYPSAKEIAKIIQQKYPDKVKKVYLYNGTPMKGGMIHKLAKRLMKRII